MSYPGSLDWQSSYADLVAAPTAAALDGWSRTAEVRAAPIDADLADTAQFCEHYGVELADSANCVVIAGKRGDTVTYAACVVLATTRADVNGTVRRRLNAKKASFAPMDDAVARSGMEYGGITPVGVPADWQVLIDRAVLDRGIVVIGSGLRRSKLALPSDALAELPNAEVIDAMAG
jgi:prolyl-tRNA editing enzyme YbaK/EbsC (Cys-tRNA(Pro) deacylase)